ncbi:dynamin family protein [Arthrobacter sp. Br18]|uniref:dynamin family protein n=1 Tax=Arthrobacter sp. Br18 TaxID=1312954 RepID=UPI0004B8299A|nr:dynamin family protein [Arthrobacter sp. Br18]
MKDTSAGVAELIADALGVYGNDPQLRTELESYAQRLNEPLRVAVAGMVKAGKSTLLNAIIGEEVAPTDTGECTRIVTWYRYADTPRITLYPLVGKPRSLAVRRVRGRLQFDLGQARAEDIGRIVVDWPAESLRNLTLIDTPGIASLSSDVSARATTFLTPEDAPSEADAVLYLMRHLHASDLKFLEAFRDTSAGRTGTVNALAVLSRADEVGAGRIDALLSAGQIADRYRHDPALRALALGVVPIAGLLAQTARTLRQDEFNALLKLARLDKVARERMLISADRFCRPDAELEVTKEARASLLERFGLFGIRLALVLLRNGITEPTALAHELAKRSGLRELMLQVTRQFESRGSQLRARTALTGVRVMMKEHPREGAAQLAATVECLESGAHELTELRLLARLRGRDVPLAPPQAADAERLIGGSGAAPAARLGLPDSATPQELRAQALGSLHRWRLVSENPLTDRAALEACQVVVRSCEALLAAQYSRQSASGGPALAGHLAGPEPSGGTGEQTGDKRRAG